MTGPTNLEESTGRTKENIESLYTQNSGGKQSSGEISQKSLVRRNSSEETGKEDDPVPPARSKWRRVMIIAGLAYTNFWMSASISVQAPFFPREAEMKGATPTQYGLVFGIYELVVLLMSPVYGKLMPRVTPKFLMTSGTLVGGVACTLFGLLDRIPPGPQFIVLAFIVRILEGIGASALFTASFTIVAVEFPDSVATSFALTETFVGLGLIVGPTIGGALYQVGGYILPFVINGAFLILGCGLLAVFLPKSDGERTTVSRNVFAFLFDGGIICYGLSIISCVVFIGFNDATLEPHLREFNLSPLKLGLIFIILGGVYAVTTPIWGFICDKGANPLYISLFGYSLTCAGMLFIAPAPFIPFKTSLWTVILSLLVVGLGLAAKFVAAFVGSLENTTERGFPDNIATYGMVSAFFTVACSTGGFVGPSLGGLLLDTTGYSMGTVIIFAIELLCMILLVVYIIVIQLRKASKKQENEQLLCPDKKNATYSTL